MDVINGYAWAIDGQDNPEIGGGPQQQQDELNKKIDSFQSLFRDQGIYTVCDAARLAVYGVKNGVNPGENNLRETLELILNPLRKASVRTRHVQSNTLLNMITTDTVEEITTIVTFAASDELFESTVEYNGYHVGTLIRDPNDGWQFSRLVVRRDGPGIRGGARRR